MEKEASVPSSLQTDDASSKTCNKKRCSDSEEEEEDEPPVKKSKHEDSVNEILPTGQFLDNKFVLSETNGVYICVRPTYMPPDQRGDGKPGQVGIWLGFCKKDVSGLYLTPAPLGPYNLSFCSTNEFHLTTNELQTLCQLMPKLNEQVKRMENELLSCNGKLINIDGNLYFYKKVAGVGASGKVLHVFDVDKLMEVALKFQSPGKAAVEVEVLQEMQFSRHCPRFFKNSISEINGERKAVSSLELLGKDLIDHCHDLKKENRLPMSVIFSLWLQALQSVQDLHSIGFIHRDIKPGNFMMGNSAKKDTLFLIDFNMVRKYRDRNGNHLGCDTFDNSGMIEKYQEVDRYGNYLGFASFRPSIGTVRYASIDAHNSKKCVSRRDDCISMLYSFVEILNGSLPWREFDNEPDQVLAMKREQKMEDFINDLPGGVEDFYKHVFELGFADTPDYKSMARYLKDAMKECRLKECRLKECRLKENGQL